MIVTSLSRDLATLTVHLGKPERAPANRILKTYLRFFRRASVDSRPRDFQPARTSGCSVFRAMGSWFHTFSTLAIDTAPTWVPAGRQTAVRLSSAIVSLLRASGLWTVLARGSSPTSQDVRWQRWLAGRESAYYGRILPPDLLVVLRVEPEIAVERRRGDEDEDFVRRRAAEVWDHDWESVAADSVVVIDAARPHSDVLEHIRSTVWAAL